jgi:methylmalonyl-CoA carboxyltransferase large subunit
MRTETVDLATVAEALEGLRRELSRLGERVAALEGGVAPPVPVIAPPVPKASPVAPPAPARPVAAEELGDELILIISAAIAAFLGKRPHIRQIRLIGSAAWAQQGRVTIQASHALSVHSARSQP